MNLQDLSTVELTAWSSKCESHINDLQKMLHIHSKTKAMNKNYDTDSKKYNVIMNKLKEVSKIVNEIFAEIDSRALKKIGSRDRWRFLKAANDL